jgi:hypothetical protein
VVFRLPYPKRDLPEHRVRAKLATTGTAHSPRVLCQVGKAHATIHFVPHHGSFSNPMPHDGPRLARKRQRGTLNEVRGRGR